MDRENQTPEVVEDIWESSAISKQIEELHDALKEVLDPDDFGWINCSTEVVIDDVVRVCVARLEKLTAENDSLQARLEVNKIMKRKLEKALEKAEYDRDRYARKIEELTVENERLRAETEQWRKDWSDNQRQWDEAYEKLEAENAEQDEAILRALRHMGEVRREARADTAQKMSEEIKHRCIEGGIYPAFVARVVEDVARETIEKCK